MREEAGQEWRDEAEEEKEVVVRIGWQSKRWCVTKSKCSDEGIQQGGGGGEGGVGGVFQQY